MTTPNHLKLVPLVPQPPDWVEDIDPRGESIPCDGTPIGITRLRNAPPDAKLVEPDGWCWVVEG